MRRVLIAIAALFILAGCDTPVPTPAPTQLDFSGQPYRINVATISVAKDYVSPKHLPNVEHLADITPARAVNQWVVQRIVASGSQGSLEVDIKDASVILKELPKEKHGIEGMMTKEQTEEYNGTLEVELKIYDPTHVLPVAHLSVLVHASHTLREDATLLERKALYHQMTVELVNQLSLELDKNIHQYFANYLM